MGAIARIYLSRILRREARVSDVPARWRGEVAGLFEVKGHPAKAELLDRCALLGIDVPEGATNPQLASLIQSLYEEVA